MLTGKYSQLAQIDSRYADLLKDLGGFECCLFFKLVNSSLKHTEVKVFVLVHTE